MRGQSSYLVASMRDLTAGACPRLIHEGCGLNAKLSTLSW